MQAHGLKPLRIRPRGCLTLGELVVVGISQEPEATLRPFATEEGMSYPVASGNTR